MVENTRIKVQVYITLSRVVTLLHMLYEIPTNNKENDI